jgi:hypothetical protein
MTIAADLAGIGGLHFVLKPLTTLLIIAWAWPRGGDAPARQRWIRIGLVWSLVGDVALLWPQQGFLPGLVSFLLAHLAYIVAFTRGLRLAAGHCPSWPTRWWPARSCPCCGRVCRRRCAAPVLAYVGRRWPAWRRRPARGGWPHVAAPMNPGRGGPRWGGAVHGCRMRRWP